MTNEQFESHIQQANIHEQKGNFDEAELLASEVLAELDNPSIAFQDNDTVEHLRARALLILAMTELQRGMYDKAIELAQGVLVSAEENIHIHDQLPRTYDILGMVYNNRGSYDTALDYHSKALAGYEELGNTAQVAFVTNNIGFVHHNCGDIPLALEYLTKALAINEELGEKSGIATSLNRIGLVHSNRGDLTLALEYHDKALAMREELVEKSGVASITGNIGLVYSKMGDFPLALKYMEKALATNEELGDKKMTGGTLVNIGAVFSKMGDHSRAIEYFSKALTLFDEIGEMPFKAIVIGNIGAVNMYTGNYPLALEYFGKALAANEDLGIKNGEIISNIGAVHYHLGDYWLALEYYSKSLSVVEELGQKTQVASSIGNIGELYATKKFEGYDPAKAEEMLLKSIAMDEEIGEKLHLYSVHKALAELYENEKRWEEAYVHHKKYHELEKEVQSEEAKKSANLMEQRKQTAEREKEIAITKAASDAKHQATEELLHNVLPPSIAHRILGGEKLIAEKLPGVSVLFADIVNFTKLSQRITPEELVEGLDRIFSTLDALAEKYGLEKIKTIGDAYMVVSGAPIPRSDHAEAMAYFALEMMEAMKEFRSISTGEEIQLRIGIHSGEVVAGVIGKKKFAYDLWGDAVNTASRMESHGEAGKIHVSEEFMRALSLSSPTSPMSLHFQERGEMEIKGKGMMKTYFLEAEQ